MYKKQILECRQDIEKQSSKQIEIWIRTKI